jgi:c-di-GMP-binding flagellar brake protein YcgR
MDERRRAARISVSFSVRWQGSWAKRDGHLVDLSIGGCFIRTEVMVKGGEPVKLEIQIPKGHINLMGEVRYTDEEMGFALQFTEISDADLKQLQWLIKAEAYQSRRGLANVLKGTKQP